MVDKIEKIHKLKVTETAFSKTLEISKVRVLKQRLIDDSNWTQLLDSGLSKRNVQAWAEWRAKVKAVPLEQEQTEVSVIELKNLAIRKPSIELKGDASTEDDDAELDQKIKTVVKANNKLVLDFFSRKMKEFEDIVTKLTEEVNSTKLLLKTAPSQRDSVEQYKGLLKAKILDLYEYQQKPPERSLTILNELFSEAVEYLASGNSSKSELFLLNELCGVYDISMDDLVAKVLQEKKDWVESFASAEALRKELEDSLNECYSIEDMAQLETSVDGHRHRLEATRSDKTT